MRAGAAALAAVAADNAVGADGAHATAKCLPIGRSAPKRRKLTVRNRTGRPPAGGRTSAGTGLAGRCADVVHFSGIETSPDQVVAGGHARQAGQTNPAPAAGARVMPEGIIVYIYSLCKGNGCDAGNSGVTCIESSWPTGGGATHRRRTGDLKLTWLDADSQLSKNPLSTGRGSGIVAVGRVPAVGPRQSHL